MASRSVPTVLLFSASRTLAEVDPLLRRAGARLIRVASVEPRPVDPARWLEAIARGPVPDIVVVTSRAAVTAGVIPWRRKSGPFPPTTEFWAVGPGTAHALRQAGMARVHRPRTPGATAIAQALRRQAPQRVVYLRSDVAGPGLARALRAHRHRVIDPIVYRLETPPRLTTRARRDLAAADVLVVTSPSALADLRRRSGPRMFARLTRSTRLVVLGTRSLRAARGHGFRGASLIPPTTAQRFTRRLLRELRDARA
ncbi:MAG: uroporphyrinogen-III synthase [Thermoplasmata archaeon]